MLIDCFGATIIDALTSEIERAEEEMTWRCRQNFIAVMDCAVRLAGLQALCRNTAATRTPPHFLNHLQSHASKATSSQINLLRPWEDGGDEILVALLVMRTVVSLAMAAVGGEGRESGTTIPPSGNMSSNRSDRTSVNIECGPNGCALGEMMLPILAYQ